MDVENKNIDKNFDSCVFVSSTNISAASLIVDKHNANDKNNTEKQKTLTSKTVCYRLSYAVLPGK